MLTKFFMEDNGTTLRLTYGKLLASAFINEQSIAVTINAQRALSGVNAETLKRRVCQIVEDLRVYLVNIDDDWAELPISVQVKALHYRKLHYYRFEFKIDARPNFSVWTLDEILDKVLPKPFKHPKRYGWWFFEADSEKPGHIHCFNPVDEIQALAFPGPTGMSFQVHIETDDPRVNPQHTFSSGDNPPVKVLNDSLMQFMDDCGMEKPQGDGSPDDILEQLALALAAARHMPTVKKVFHLSAEGNVEMDVVPIFGFKLREEGNPTDCENQIYWADDSFWIYSETRLDNDAKYTTLEKKTEHEIVAMLARIFTHHDPRSAAAPSGNVLN